MQIINLRALSQWHTLPPKKGLVFDHGPDTVRAVRLLLNLETVTSLYIEPEDADINPRLLVTAGPGLVQLDFDAVGAFAVFADEQAGEVQYQSTEFEPANLEPIDDTSFTEIVNRRAVDPLFEEMWYRANQNLERRLAAQNLHHQQQLAAIITQGKTDDNQDETVGDPPTEGGDEGDDDAGTQAS